MFPTKNDLKANHSRHVMSCHVPLFQQSHITSFTKHLGSYSESIPAQCLGTPLQHTWFIKALSRGNLT